MITRQAVPRLWPFTRLLRLGDTSEPSLAPQTAQPAAPLPPPCTRPSRGTPRRLPVTPLIPDQRGYGESPVRLRRHERAVGDAVPPISPKTAKNPRPSRAPRQHTMLGFPTLDFGL